MIRRASDCVVEQRENMIGGSGTIGLRYLFKPEEMSAPVRLCAELVVPPGAGIGLHRHDNEEEIYVITAGSGLLTENGAETRVSAGDAILTGNGAEHAVRNDGTADLIILAVIITY